MTPATPTPGAEPHQPGEREAIVALARVLVEDAGFDHDDASDMAERLLQAWPDERRAGDVEAPCCALVTADAFDDAWHDDGKPCEADSPGGFMCTRTVGHDGAHIAMGEGGDVCEVWHYQAAQIAALTPTRGVSAEQVEAAPSVTRTIGDALRTITAAAQAEAEQRWDGRQGGKPVRSGFLDTFVAGALWLAGELSPAALGIEVRDA